MITPKEVTSKYRVIEPYLPKLRDIIRGSLQSYCDQNRFALVSRIKTVESLAEKIESGRFSAWSEIDDLDAFAIIVPTLTDEEAVLDFLKSTFVVRAIRKRGSSRKAPDVFRFDTTRVIGLLKPPLAKEDQHDGLFQTAFEIQIRSAFEHAWAVTTHALTFKSNEIDWKRMRLSAQLKASVEQLDMLILGFEDASLKLQESEWLELQDRKSIAEFFRKEAEAGNIPRELLPKDLNRFSENLFRAVKAVKAKRHDAAELTNQMTAVIKEEIKELGTDNIPRSVSLLQFAFGCLTKANVIVPPLEKYVPLITPELELLYPPTKEFETRFSFID